MPTWGNAIQAFVAAVAVKSAVDQKKANRARRKQLDEQSRLKERKTLQKSFTILLNSLTISLFSQCS
jgi:hypothetical protein